MRVGIGYDLHRLVPNRKLILGGVEISYDFGLLGHSDADVLTHAICDAMLGAAGLGDIGGHFPDTDAVDALGYGSFGLSAVLRFQERIVGRFRDVSEKFENEAHRPVIERDVAMVAVA